MPHNLSTGEIWFYLAEDYSTPWYTNINALLKKGKQSILLATKFPKNASLKLNKILENGGNTIEIREFLLKGKFDDIQKESILRLSFLNYFYIEKDFTNADLLFPEWEKYIHTNKRLDSTEVKITKAQYLATTGKYQGAINILNDIKGPNWRREELLRTLEDNEDYTTRIELIGYQKAKVVLIEVKGDYNLFRFLKKTPKGWILKMKSDRKEIKYCFYVDSKRVINPSQPIIKKQETIKGDFAEFNVLKL
ncbi:MAG: hypothetical protein ACR2KX_15725 [Chitinophagaceae bacterium]